MQNVQVSVIIPVYNAVNYIRACLDSVEAQTLKNIEIILVEDGSTDGSDVVLREYAERNPKFKIVYNMQKDGVKAARSRGLRNAVGDYIGWVDADDIIEPDMFETLYETARAEDADLVYCNYDFYPMNVSKKKKWVQKFEGKYDWRFLEHNTIHWNTIASRELLQSVNYEELLLDVSEYAKLALLLHAKKIVYVDKQLYHHRIGHISTSGGSYRGKVDFYKKGVESTLNLKEKVLAGTGFEKDLDEYFDYRLIYKYLLVCIVAAYNRDEQSYREAAARMHELGFRNNKYTNIILTKHYGKTKAFVLQNIIPESYFCAKILSAYLDRRQ